MIRSHEIPRTGEVLDLAGALIGDLTPVSLHKLRRDLSIAILARIGATVEFLADVHDLDPSSVRRILRDSRRKDGPRES